MWRPGRDKNPGDRNGFRPVGRYMPAAAAAAAAAAAVAALE